MKLLGVPNIPKGGKTETGKLIASATCNLLNEWHCSDNISAMVFDTTAANTGMYISLLHCSSVLLSARHARMVF